MEEFAISIAGLLVDHEFRNCRDNEFLLGNDALAFSAMYFSGLSADKIIERLCVDHGYSRRAAPDRNVARLRAIQEKLQVAP